MNAAQAYVGRHLALGQLSRAIASARAGRGTLLLVGGEAGIGKTRLLEEGYRLATDAGFDVRWTTCWSDDAPAYWPWIQIIRSHLESTNAADVARDVGSRSRIRILVPELADHLPSYVDPALPSLDLDEERFRLFDDVGAFLHRTSRRRPLFVVIDDLHLADATSIHLLRSVAAMARTSHLLVVSTYRVPEVGSRALGPLLPDLISHADHLTLNGLSIRETAALLENVTATMPDEQLVETVHSRSGGNPLFVRELGRLLVAQGWAADPRAGVPAVPPALIPIIERRTALLPPQCRTILEACAVVGATFRSDVVASAVNAGLDVVEQALDDAIRARIIVKNERDRGAMSFAHGLVRDVMYEAIPPDVRASLHRRIAEAIEARSETTDRAGELVHHFTLAGERADLLRAAGHAERAAAASLDVWAFDEAIAHARRATELVTAASPHDDRRRGRLLVRLAEIQARAGRTEDSRRSLADTAEIARTAGDAELLARAAIGYGSTEQFAGGVGVDPVLVRLLEEALDALPVEDSIYRIRLMRLLALEITYREPERSRALVGELTEMSSRLGDHESRAAALELRHSMLLGAEDRTAERLSIATELLRLGEEHRRTGLVVYGRIWRVYNLLALGDIAGLDAEIAAFEQLVDEARLPSYRWFPALWRAMRRLLEGRIDEAEMLAARALELGEARGQSAVDHFGMQLIAIRREQDRISELVPLIRDSAERYPEIPSYRCALALAYAESGEIGAARSEFDRLMADDLAAVPRDYNWTVCLLLLADTCGGLGDGASAEVLYRCLLPFEGRTIVVGYATVCGGAVDHYLGVLAATAGRSADAIRRFEAALAQHRRQGAAGWIVRTQYELGRALAPTDRGRATSLLRTARTTANELGLIAMARRIDAAPGAAAPEPDGGAIGANVFRREGEFWTMTFDARTVRLKDAKGIRDIVRLLAAPGHEMHSIDLVAEATGPAPDAPRSEELFPAGEHGDLVLDEQARKAYRERIAELRSDVEEAEGMRDPVRAERARSELEALTRMLSSGYGLGGRSRRSADPAERARKAVGERIRDSLRRISEVHPSLGEHLARSVNTGIFCSYTPDRPITWQL